MAIRKKRRPTRRNSALEGTRAIRRQRKTAILKDSPTLSHEPRGKHARHTGQDQYRSTARLKGDAATKALEEKACLFSACVYDDLSHMCE
jgi:hypothetical protein